MQALIIVSGVYISCCYNLVLGLIIIIPATLIDYAMRTMRKDNISMIIKSILLFQSVLIIVCMTHSNMWNAMKQDDIFTKTKNNVGKFDEVRDNLPDFDISSHVQAPDISHKVMVHREYSDSVPSKDIIKSVFGKELMLVDYSPDLTIRSPTYIRNRYSKLFMELDSIKYRDDMKNPCWNVDNNENQVACLPYAYILGQPKCGTSDLYERLKRHPNVVMPKRKEVRWFTRGEFTTEALQEESDDTRQGGRRREARLGRGSSIYSFTQAFNDISEKIRQLGYNSSETNSLVTIDGGPHTFWWPTQNADGSVLLDEVSIPQLLKEVQPNTKFVVTISDPANRLYSDYNFLNDDLRPVRPDGQSSKSPEEFHQRVVKQINDFKECITKESSKIGNDPAAPVKSPLWFRASQVCAHDRQRFAKGGWGRISIGLYVLYLEKWLESYSLDRFLFVRLEDYSTNPQQYMFDVFSFLGLPAELSNFQWDSILLKKHANEHRIGRIEMREDTRQMLNEFHKPYNELFVQFLTNGYRSGNRNAYNYSKFLWEDVEQHDLVGHPHDQHGVHRVFGADFNHKDESLNENKGHEFKGILDSIMPKKLRGGKGEDILGNADSELLKRVNPKKLDISALPRSNMTTMSKILLDNFDIMKPIVTIDDAANRLCAATFTLDLKALEYFLYDIGLPGNIFSMPDNKRNPFHCLSYVYTMSESHGKSFVYAVLKGKDSWISNFVDPPITGLHHSILAKDITDGLQSMIDKVAKWLLAAEVSMNHQDSYGNTPLTVAVIGGLTNLVKFYLVNGADPNVANHDLRTPLHFAAALGHTEILGLLMRHGGNTKLADRRGVIPQNIIENPGPILPDDALKFLNITQRPVKQIERKVNPELSPDSKVGWKAGPGGWGVERLKGYEDDLECEIDQYWAHEITGKDIFHNYLLHSSPVLIRGLLNDWEVLNTFKPDVLIEKHGQQKVQVSDIPYANKYGGTGSQEMTLQEYIEEMIDHRIVGGKYPWYVFKGHPISNGDSEKPESLVKYNECPTPPMLQEAFTLFGQHVEKDESKPFKEREIYVNAQWALGGEGTGAPVHFHNSAWNALVYGAKKWVIYPPHLMIMSNKQILDYFETDMVEYRNRGVRPHTCVQLAGDVMIIPESWGHGVLNIQESVAIATEAKSNLWRVKPLQSVLQFLPDFNRPKPKPSPRRSLDRQN